MLSGRNLVVLLRSASVCPLAQWEKRKRSISLHKLGRHQLMRCLVAWKFHRVDVGESRLPDDVTTNDLTKL